MSSPGAPAGSSRVPRIRPKRRGLLAALGVNSLLLSILLHVSFGVVATYLIVEHFQKKHVNFHAMAPPSQHVEVEHKVELAKRNNVESAPPDLKRIVTTAVSPITLPDVPVVPENNEITPTSMSGVDGEIGSGMGSGLGGGSGGEGGPSPPFGASDGKGLEGYLYDLKQTHDEHPLKMDNAQYYSFLTQFVSSSWNDEMLAHYFKSKRPLYAKSFAIAMRPSESAPQAFRVENEVKPGLWAVHYHGKVTVPESGDYRFIGFGDNVLVVRIGSRVVLDAGWNSLLPQKQELRHEFPYRWNKRELKSDKSELKMGTTFHMEAEDPVDMDVLIGDDGGLCGFYLLIMNVAHTYEKLPDGTPKVPFFQLGDTGPPHFSASETYPPYSTTPEPWQDVEAESNL